MACGIYLLKFYGTNKVYVGQSDNIGRRFDAHTRSFTNGYVNYKLLDAYNLYGLPTLEIVEQCKISELDSKELEYIKVFDSVNNGLNILAGGLGTLKGDKHPASKYTNEQIYEVFIRLIQEPISTLTSIAEQCSVPLSTIENISSCKSHCWLRDMYPLEYLQLERLKGNRISNGSTALGRGKVYPPIYSPDGNVYKVTNAKQFAIEHNLNHSHLVGVLNGKRKTHKQWHL